MPTTHRILLLASLAAAAACGDDNILPDPTSANFVDTVSVGSLTDTPLTSASGFSVTTGAIRTDQTAEFDFAYDIEGDPATGRKLFLPRAALGISSSSADPGVQRREESFDDLTEAPSNGYITEEPVEVALGDRFAVRSRIVCSSLGVPVYAKIEIIGFDDNAVQLKVLANVNCGYRGLEPGLPDR